MNRLPPLARRRQRRRAAVGLDDLVGILRIDASRRFGAVGYVAAARAAPYVRVERGAQRAQLPGVSVGDILALAGIAPQIVELLARRANVLIAAVGHRHEWTPAE